MTRKTVGINKKQVKIVAECPSDVEEMKTEKCTEETSDETGSFMKPKRRMREQTKKTIVKLTSVPEPKKEAEKNKTDKKQHNFNIPSGSADQTDGIGNTSIAM